MHIDMGVDCIVAPGRSVVQALRTSQTLSGPVKAVPSEWVEPLEWSDVGAVPLVAL